ncbi:MAG: hypothetical protein ACREBJ_00175 [Nitrosotalea sp.]
MVQTSKEYQRAYYEKNKIRIIERQTRYNEEKKNERLQYAKNYYETNKNSVLECQKERQQQNRNQITEYHTKYTKKRIKIDPVFKLRNNNFKKCWALENLRPLLSKTNLEKRDK